MTYFGRCQSTLTAPFTAIAPITSITMINSGSLYSYWTVWDTNVGGTWYHSETTLSSGTLFAEPVTVMWQFSDLSKFPRAYATALAVTMGVELQAGLRADSNTDFPSKPAAVLSVGAKVGIAIGAVLGFALLVGVAVIMCLRRRRKARQRVAAEDRTVPAHELPGQSLGLKRFYQGEWRAEVDGRTQRAEMEAKQEYELPVPPVELEAPQCGEQQERQFRDPAPLYDVSGHFDSANDTASEKKGGDETPELPKKVSR